MERKKESTLKPFIKSNVKEKNDAKQAIETIHAKPCAINQQANPNNKARHLFSQNEKR